MKTKTVVPILSSFLPWIFVAMLPACTPQGDPGVGESFADDFERAHVGDMWKRTGGNWRVQDGQLRVRGARNHPIWLRRTLPRDVRIEFDVRSESPDGDIKVEVFGDGSSYAKTDSYTATSYVIIFGGWNNTLNVLARMDEHSADRVVGPARKVQVGKTYHFRIDRRGTKIQAWVDDEILVEMEDPQPLWGRGHDHFAFNNWQSELRFDNLKIGPL